MAVLLWPALGGIEGEGWGSVPGSRGQNEGKGSKRGSRATAPKGLCPDPTHKGHLTPSFTPPGTIPPIKSAQGEGDDVKKLFTIGCPVILATLGVALLFIVRKKRREKRLKRLRGRRGSYGLPGREGWPSATWTTFHWLVRTIWTRESVCVPLKGELLFQPSETSALTTSSSVPPRLCAWPNQGWILEVHTGKTILLKIVKHFHVSW